MPAAAGDGSRPPAKRKPERHDEITFLQETEIQRLFAVITSPRDRAIFRIAYHAGLRASEVGMLEMRDYDPRTERLNVHRLKGSNSGIHGLNREEQKVMHAWLKVRGKFPGKIFLSRNRQPIGRRMLDYLMKKYGKMAGIPAELTHFHILKHCCGTHLANKGWDVLDIQNWMGHQNIANTMIYIRVSNAKREQMEAELSDWK
jgi:site-specific recombinase XerD